MAVAPCQFLPWDSGHFGLRIGRVTESDPDTLPWETVQEWQERERIDCLYLLLDADHRRDIHEAEDRGFRQIDIRLTLERDMADPLPPLAIQLPGRFRIRPARRDDLPDLQAIARVSHEDTRFFKDPRFPRAAAARLYEIWIEKSLSSGAADVWIAEESERPCGYLSCELDTTARRARFGLVALDESVRGQGVAQVMMNQALQSCAQKGASTVSVVTQGYNVPAQRLYQRLGFLSSEVQLWFHRWRTQA